MIKPKILQRGDKVAAISLSWGGPGTFPHRYEIGKHQLQNDFGLNVVETPHQPDVHAALWDSGGDRL